MEADSDYREAVEIIKGVLLDVKNGRYSVEEGADRIGQYQARMRMSFREGNKKK